MLSWLQGERNDVNALIARKHYGKAIKVLEAKLEVEPDSVFLRQQLADVLERHGEPERAVKILARLVDQFAAEGFVAKGIAVLKKIQRIDPSVDINDRIAKLLHTKEDDAPGSAWLVRAGGEQEETVPSGTSELVLAPDWLPNAAMRDDFNWSPLFSGMTGDEVSELFSEIRLMIKRPGSIIFSEGEIGGSVFVLAAGTARVYKRDRLGRNHQKTLLRAGSFFGTSSVLFGAPREHTVIAAEECELLEIDQVSFERIGHRHPHVREQLERLDQGV